MYCKYCGEKIQDGISVCPSCGRTLTEAGPDTDTEKDPHSSVHIWDVLKPQKNFSVCSFVCWGGALVGLIALLFPFVTLNMRGFSSTYYLFGTADGIYFAVIFLVIAVVNFSRFYLADLLGALVSGIWLVIESYSLNESLGANAGLIRFGAGRTVMIIGILLLFAGGVAGLILTALTRTENE